jgi:hypothetical protein
MRPRAKVRAKGLSQWNIPVTLMGIEPAFIRFVAQSPNQLLHRFFHFFRVRIILCSHQRLCLPSFLLNNQPDAPIIQIYSVMKLYMFRTSSLPIIRSFYCTFCSGKFHAGFWWPLPSRVRMELQSSSILTLYSIECTVENSWWWAEEDARHL